MSLIEVTDLHKVYRVQRPSHGLLGPLRALLLPQTDEIHAVAGASFAVEAGESVAYLGPNGAGKSTTIKILTGILVPSSGRVCVGGLVPWRARHANARQIGVVFGQRTQLYWDLPLIETLRMLREIFQIPWAVYRRNLDRFRTLLELEEFLHVPVRQLSLGQRMRGELAAALLHSPRIVYLDEPTIGLDIVAKRQILEIFQEVNRQEGVTVILTTHNLAEVEELCSRIILIDHGRVLYDGGLSEFKWRHAPGRTLVVELVREMPAHPIAGTETIRQDGRTLLIRFPRGRAPAELIREVTARYDVRDLTLREPSLEDVLRDIYQQPSRLRAAAVP